MNPEISASEVNVSLPITVIQAILSLRSALDEKVASALRNSLSDARTLDRVEPNLPFPRTPVQDHGKYLAAFLGRSFEVDTLASVFASVVDMMADVAPEVLLSLAEVRTRGRRLIAPNRQLIHLYSPHLPVLQTCSGWWISKNISQEQLIFALRKTCEVSGLMFGKDIKFLGRYSGRQCSI